MTLVLGSVSVALVQVLTPVTLGWDSIVSESLGVGMTCQVQTAGGYLRTETDPLQWGCCFIF